MKQPQQRAAEDRQSEHATHPTVSQSEPPTEPATLGSDAESLKEEIRCWPSCSSTGGQRNHHIVDDAADGEGDE